MAKKKEGLSEQEINKFADKFYKKYGKAKSKLARR